MGKRLPPDVDARIVALRDAHKTEAQIAATLTREGTPITASGVHRALGRLGRAKPRKAPKGAAGGDATVAARPSRRPPPTAPAPPDSPEAAEPDLDALAQVRRALAALERAAVLAEQEGDVARVVAAHRAATQAVALAAKLTPPPAVTVDDRPDMVAAAQRGRERLRALIARALGGGAS